MATSDAPCATVAVIPQLSRVGAICGAMAAAPNADDRNPANVTPICTVDRNRPESRARAATFFSAPRPRPSCEICDSRTLTRAISVAAKMPPTRMKAMTQAKLANMPTPREHPLAPTRKQSTLVQGDFSCNNGGINGGD